MGALSKLLLQIQSVHQVFEIPRSYNGDLVLEFPPTMGLVHHMDAMEHKFDPHLRTKPQTSNVVFPGVVRLSRCVGSLKCINEKCVRLINYHTANTSHFNGFLQKTPAPGQYCEVGEKSLRCHFCKTCAFCIASCDCIVYYVMPADETATRLMIHHGTHCHDGRSGA